VCTHASRCAQCPDFSTLHYPSSDSHFRYRDTSPRSGVSTPRGTIQAKRLVGAIEHVCWLAVDKRVRGSMDFPRIPVVILEALSRDDQLTGNYRVLTPAGRLRAVQARTHLHHVSNGMQTSNWPKLHVAYLSWQRDPNSVPMVNALATAAARSHIIGGAKGVGCCNCTKTNCRQGNCSCFKGNTPCTAKCHRGDHSRCQNC
jgi:hypothetical protein